jgi:hypothetical protein
MYKVTSVWPHQDQLKVEWNLGKRCNYPVGTQPPLRDKRAAQLAAAEKRAIDNSNRGLRSPNKGTQLNESAKRQELLGRINAHYASMNKDPPLGLNLASIEQLKNHYEGVKKAAAVGITPNSL